MEPKMLLHLCNMEPKMLLHIENVLNCLEDPEYRDELLNAVHNYITANTNRVCDAVVQLMAKDDVISENIITEIVKLKPSRAGEILSNWCMKSEKNVTFF